MKKRLPEILCMAAVLVGLLALAAQAGADAPGVPVRLPGRVHPAGGGGEPRSLRLHSAAAGRE